MFSTQCIPGSVQYAHTCLGAGLNYACLPAPKAVYFCPPIDPPQLTFSTSLKASEFALAAVGREKRLDVSEYKERCDGWQKESALLFCLSSTLDVHWLPSGLDDNVSIV